MKSKKNIVIKSKLANNNQNESIFYRLILAGDSGVGKTQIINVFNKKLFQNEHIPTFGIDFQIKTLNIVGKKTNIYCIDTAGSEDFSKDTGNLFLKKTNAFILIYDITSRESYNNLLKYYQYIEKALAKIREQFNRKILYIVGNKIDLIANRIISENEARQMAFKYDAKYLEVSAKSGANIDRLFDYIIQDIKREESNSSDSGWRNKGNSIYRNTATLKSNDSLKNINNNNINNNVIINNTANESGLNFETRNYFLQTNNYYINNNGYINNRGYFNNNGYYNNRGFINNNGYYNNNIYYNNNGYNNNINQFQNNQNTNYYYYQNNNNVSSKCIIF